MKKYREFQIIELNGKFVVQREDGSFWKQKFNSYNSAVEIVKHWTLEDIKNKNMDSFSEHCKKLNEAYQIAYGE